MQIDANRVGDLLANGLPRDLSVETECAADQILAVDIAQREESVGQGRHLATLAIADRARLGACAFRADLESASLVEPDHAASARADL